MVGEQLKQQPDSGFDLMLRYSDLSLIKRLWDVLDNAVLSIEVPPHYLEK